MNENNKVAYAPFHAVNEFMRDDFRRKIILEVYAGIARLSSETQKRVNQLTRKEVEIQGFRDSLKAPQTLKARSAERVFQKSPAFAAAILTGWAELHDSLARQVFDLISGEGWNPYPIEVDRSKLPGFLPEWPENQNFEQLDKKFRELYSESQDTDDDINLMLVWLAGRLPYHQSQSEHEK